MDLISQTSTSLVPDMLRLFIPLLTLLLLASTSLAQTRPVTGKANPRFAKFDQVVQDFMDRVGATSASLAISIEGELLHSRGFGWKDSAKKQSTPPDALFRIASVTKPFTAAAIRLLAEEGKLKLNEPMLPYLKVKPPVDDRVKKITIEQLLNHRGGWDRKTSGDVMFMVDQAYRELKLNRSPTPQDMAEWGLTRKLDFTPGDREAYSNYGYCLLGRVMESVTKKSYLESLNQVLLKPQGIQDVKLAAGKKFDPREVWYNIPTDSTFNIDVMDAHGGLLASAPAVIQFAEKFHVTGNRREDQDRGNGLFFGSIPGTTAMMRQHPTGWNLVILVNARREKHINPDNELLRKWIDAAFEGLK